MGDGFNLGRWCARRRRDYRQNELSQAQIDALNEVPGWVWDPLAARFQAGLVALKAYVADHGELPKGKTNVDGFNLGSWCDSRRQEHKNDKLSQAQIDALNEVPGWVWAGTVGRKRGRRDSSPVASESRKKHKPLPSSSSSSSGSYTYGSYNSYS